MLLVDSYERRARLTPGLLVVLPIALTAVTLGLRANPVVAAFISLLSVVGGPFVLASIVRNRGLALQNELFRDWNGPPTRRFLELDNTERPATQKQAWRHNVERVTNMTLPTSQEETTDPQGATGSYDAAVAILRTKTRDKKKFKLVFEENRNFGYWRNLRAMRPFGTVVAILCLLVVIAGAIAAAQTDILASTSRTSFVVGATLDVVVLAFWLFVPTKTAIKRVGESYAEQLLDSTSVL